MSAISSLQIHDYEASPCPPLAVVNDMGRTIRSSVRVSEIGHPQANAVLARSEYHLDHLCDNIGSCDKIKSTPMVFGYVATLRTFLMLWLSTLPMCLIGEYGWLATPAISLLAFLFLNVEQMAIEIEQPFGNDANDLPLEEYIREVEKWMLYQLPSLQDTAHPRPSRIAHDLQQPPPPAVCRCHGEEVSSSLSDDIANAPAAESALQGPLQGEGLSHGPLQSSHAEQLCGARHSRPAPLLCSSTILSQQPGYPRSIIVPSSSAYKRYADSRRLRPGLQNPVGFSCRYKYASLERLARDANN